jgi:hypothetical protein
VQASEREIFARERAEGRRILSAELGDGRCHRPDLVLRAEPPIAVEVELTDKSARRLDELLRAWRLAVARRQFGRVVYLCSPRALPYVQRAASRTKTDVVIDIEALQHSEGKLVLARASALLQGVDTGLSATQPSADSVTSVVGFGRSILAPAGTPANP